MNEKEMWVYFLAYNLIRLLMCEAALQAEILPRQISFKHTLQVWVAWIRHPWEATGDGQTAQLYILIAEQRVGTRLGKLEPRAVKRRPKPYPRLINRERWHVKTFESMDTQRSLSKCHSSMTLIHQALRQRRRRIGFADAAFAL